MSTPLVSQAAALLSRPSSTAEAARAGLRRLAPAEAGSLTGARRRRNRVMGLSRGEAGLPAVGTDAVKIDTM
jgi:hypothetical protein